MLTCHSILKSFRFTTLLSIALFSFISCGQREVDSKQVAAELKKPNSDTAKEKDKRFLVNAVEINFEQIMLGKLAQQRSASENIKAMAMTLEESHHHANSEVSALARSKAISVPTEVTKKIMKDYDALNLKSTEEFDQEYCSMIVQNHKDAISAFESYTQSESDQDIKIWALGMIPEMRIHLEIALEMEAQMKHAVSELITAEQRIRM